MSHAVISVSKDEESEGLSIDQEMCNLLAINAGKVADEIQVLMLFRLINLGMPIQEATTYVQDHSTRTH